MAFPAFLDTNCLYGFYLRDTLLRLAAARTYRPLWSADVLRELDRNLEARASMSEQRRRHLISSMREHFNDAEVTGYSDLVSAMTCDPKDRHVLAAAVRADAEVIVTFNLRDFPESATRPYDIRVVHPDDFLLDQLDLYPEVTRSCLDVQSRGYSDPAMTVDEILERLAAAGVPDFAEAVARTIEP